MTFSTFVQKQAMAPAELPLVHTTAYYLLPTIQASNTLHGHHCEVFEESLLYFFYGRPAYRHATQTVPTRDAGFYPICFVFRAGTICRFAKRLYPFDTGAAQSGLYEPAIEPSAALSLYQLPPVIENARKLVTCFFGSDEAYLSNRPIKNLVFSSTETHPESYYRLINGGGDPTCDDRNSAVEIQVAEGVDIRENIMAVALPMSFLEDDTLAHTLLNVWRAMPLTYDGDTGMRPLEFHGTIRHLIREFYRRSRVI